jgi:hypothetical protein
MNSAGSIHPCRSSEYPEPPRNTADKASLENVIRYGPKLKPQDYAHIIGSCVNRKLVSKTHDYTNRLDARVRDGAGDTV